MRWTEDQDAMLRECAANGDSGFEASMRIGVTRNAVMGRAFRLGVTFNSRSDDFRQKRYAAMRAIMAARYGNRTL